MPSTFIANFLFFRPKCTLPLPVMREITVAKGITTGSAIRSIHKDNNVIGKAIEIKGKAISTTLVITNSANTMTGGKKRIENKTIINFLKRLSILLPKMKTPEGDTSSIEGVSSVTALNCSSFEAIVS